VHYIYTTALLLLKNDDAYDAHSHAYWSKQATLGDYLSSSIYVCNEFDSLKDLKDNRVDMQDVVGH